MKNCPNYPECLWQYSRKFIGLRCPKCSVSLPRRKLKPRVEESLSSQANSNDKEKYQINLKDVADVVQIDSFLFSVKSHMLSRKFVKLAESCEEKHFCDSEICINSRTLAVKNSKDFLCKHILMVLEAKERKTAGTPHFISQNKVFDVAEQRKGVVEKERIRKHVETTNLEKPFVLLKLSDQLFTMT